MDLRAFGMSKVGRTRHHNEDFYAIEPDRHLYLVADGMGGHSHGEVASRTAVEAMQEFLTENLPENGSSPGMEEDRLLHVAVLTAHERVLRAIRQDGTLSGMGTTMVALLVKDHPETGQRAVVAHVGDSRAYRFRQDRLELLTQDHTWVHEQVLAGYLSEEQARVHPLKNVVTRALGGEGDVQVDVQEWPVVAGDRFLLCSDGLTTMLRDNEIEAGLRQGETPEDTCRHLVGAALERGGFDDVTVVLVAVS